MNAKIHVIEKDGEPEWVVISYETYLRLVEEAEMLGDIRDYDTMKLAIESGEEELVPSEIVFAQLDGENPIKSWREYRGLSQQELASAVGISASYLSQIESGKRAGSTEVLAAIARALNVALDDIVNV